MDLIISWAKNHPVAYPLILAAFGAIVSIFSPRIYRFISEWPAKTADTLATRRLANELRLLKWLRGNAYNLVLHLTSFALGIFYALFLWAVILTIYAGITKTEFNKAVFFGIAAGMVVSKLFELKRLVKQLYDVENRIKTLEEALSESKKKATAQASS